MSVRTKATGTLVAVAVVIAGLTFWGSAGDYLNKGNAREVHFTGNWNPELQVTVKYGMQGSERTSTMRRTSFQQSMHAFQGSTVIIRITTPKNPKLLVCFITVNNVVYGSLDPDQPQPNDRTCQVRAVVR